MVTNILTVHPSPELGGGVKRPKFTHINMVMLHIRLKGMSNAATGKNLFCPYRTDGIKRSKHFFYSESSHVSYQIKLILEHSAPCKHIFCPYTHPQTWGGVKGQNISFSESRHVAYQLNGNIAPCKHIFCPYTHTHNPWGEVNGSKHFF